MIEAIFGIITAVVIIVISRMLSKYFTAKLMATTILVAIAFIYVGFSLKDNPVGFIVLEILVALLLFFAAIIGYTRNSLFIAYGIVFHGVWDIWHHNGFVIGTHIPGYWPPFCLVVDVIDGLYFLIIFKSQKNSAALDILDASHS